MIEIDFELFIKFHRHDLSHESPSRPLISSAVSDALPTLNRRCRTLVYVSKPDLRNYFHFYCDGSRPARSIFGILCFCRQSV